MQEKQSAINDYELLHINTDKYVKGFEQENRRKEVIINELAKKIKDQIQRQSKLINI